jgi:Ca-activated chloride channel family protein
MLQIAWPFALLALPLPLLAALLLPRAPRQEGAALKVPFFERLRTLADQGARRRHWLRRVLAILAWLVLVTAAVRPQWLGEPVELPRSGRDLLLAVDISGSMETRDMKRGNVLETRLEAVKEVAGEFIQRREGDRIGLVLFGRQAYLQTPLTFDRTTVRTLLDEAEIGLAGKETAIGDAIGLSVKRLRERPIDQRVLILLTDGANTAGAVEPLQAAEVAAAENVRVHTIGVGADELLVRDFFGTRRVNPSAELDEETLSRIAGMTGGNYFRARDKEALEEIYLLLDELEPIDLDTETFRPTSELFMYPLGVALTLSALAGFLGLPWSLAWRFRRSGKEALA